MNTITTCCKASVIIGSKREHPLGGSTWGIDYKVDLCEECGKENPETVNTCDICGEPSERFRHIDGDDYCPACFEERLQETIQQLRIQMGVRK